MAGRFMARPGIPGSVESSGWLLNKLSSGDMYISGLKPGAVRMWMAVFVQVATNSIECRVCEGLGRRTRQTWVQRFIVGASEH